MSTADVLEGHCDSGSIGPDTGVARNGVHPAVWKDVGGLRCVAATAPAVGEDATGVRKVLVGGV